MGSIRIASSTLWEMSPNKSINYERREKEGERKRERERGRERG
jgi:hypothetical protein